MPRSIVFALFLVLVAAATGGAQVPDLVWIRAAGGERNEYVFFRRELTLPDSARAATLHLYADSRYALYVNGQYLGFGPVRSFHRHPYYDTYDLRPYLRPGQNVIAVQVLSNGMETYQLFDYHGGFVAWGEVVTPGGAIDLAVDTPGWLARAATGYDRTQPRFSFATGPIESWDSRPEWDWFASTTATTGWRPPVPLADQGRWGEFAPRPIPPLTQRELAPLQLLAAYPLADREQIYSFRIPTPDRNQPEYNSSRTALAYTYIYSPREQTVDVGLWWGDYYLNGTRLVPKPEQPREHYRRDYTLSLRAGWNEFVVRYGIIWGSWDFYLAVPRVANLALSATRRVDSPDLFRTYGPFDPSRNAALQALDLTRPIADLVAATENEWTVQPRDRPAAQPARDLVWQDLATDRPLNLEPDTSGAIVLPPTARGTALIYAMHETQLGRFFVTGDFPDGTQIDIGFSEELDARGQPWLYKRYQIGAGLRFITAAGRSRYESFKPYGAKYLQLNIHHPTDSVRLRGVGMVRQVYPFETVGAFRCSDPLLDRIWAAGWRTLQLCAEDSYTDTPFRERGLYAGDMLPEAAITMAVSGDLRLAEHSLRLFQDMYREEMQAGKENRHQDFPLLTLVTLDYVARYTGDWSLARAYYDNYAALLRHHLARRDEQGLLTARRVFLEWTDINKADAAMTAFQALNAHSLRLLAQWAERFGRRADAAAFTQSANAVDERLHRLLRSPEHPGYFDGRQADTLIRERHLISSVWPALFGSNDSLRTRAIVDWLATEIGDIGSVTRARKTTPYSSFYLLALLYREGRADLAEQFIRQYWRPMALHSATPTVWENFDIAGGQGTSSHAWSGHPTYFLATEALGVNLGFVRPFDRAVIEICPQSATLSWAEGTVAHPLGPVSVRWEIRGDQLWLDYQAPAGARVVVRPRGRLARFPLVVNGEPR